MAAFDAGIHIRQIPLERLLDFSARRPQLLAIERRGVRAGIQSRVTYVDGTQKDLGSHGEEQLLTLDESSRDGSRLAFRSTDALDEIVGRDEPEPEDDGEPEQEYWPQGR